MSSLVAFACTTLSAQPPASDSLDKLANDFWTWRPKYAPFTGDDVNRMERPRGMRDWSRASIEQRGKDLAGFEARWKKSDPRSWPILKQVDYSVMFYGGRLLSHLSLTRDEPGLSAEELIQLLRINQNSAIVIDSDRTRTDADVNETKGRIANECKEAGVLCWITAGREIENYLMPASVAAVYNEMTGSQRNFTLGTYQKISRVLESAYRQQWKAAFNYENNKPAAARRIAANITEIPDRLDLNLRMRELVQRIRTAN